MSQIAPDMHPQPSARLSFRCWQPSDSPLAISLWTHPEVTRFLGGTSSSQAAAERLHLEMHCQQQFGIQYWPIFLRTNGEFAGCAGLRPFNQEPGVFELGVHIARPFWGERFGEEAALAVIAFAFDHLHLPALAAGHNPENLRSKALIARLGFRLTHYAPWGPHQISHPFYRLERDTEPPPGPSLAVQPQI